MLTTGTLFFSCETTELEQLVSPNALSPDQADPDFLLNDIQMEYVSSMSTFNGISGNLSRIHYMFGRDYFSNFAANTLDGVWTNLYADMIPDIANIQSLHSADNDLSLHLGIAKVLEAHLLMMTVDFLGDIPLSETNNPTEFPTPNLDQDQDIYASAIALLGEAKTFLNNSSLAKNPPDLFYGGDATKWIKLANTLLMRADLTAGNYAAVLSASNVIEDTADDFVFGYGTNELQPDNRHPDYNTDYRSDGANIYQSNWLMRLMVGQYGDLTIPFGGEGLTDPRRRYYFYRQNWNTPNSFSLITDINGRFGPPGAIYQHDQDPDAQTLECSGNSVPTHLEFTPDEDIWCSLNLGYWGRTHGNDEGIPPDNFLRTAVGVYPAGGSFDGVADAAPFIAQFDQNGDYIGYVASTQKLFGQSVGLGKGGGGAGIEPFILASYVDFWKAEASLMTGDAAAASNYIESGTAKSIAKVMSFGALDSSADFSQAPDAATVSGFIATIKSNFDAAPLTSGLDGNGYPVEKDKMDILGEEFFVAMYGGAGDAWNFIRRTGYPRTLARSIDNNPGLFPRTLLYPATEVGVNPNFQQRLDLNTKVFWDSGILNPAN